MELDIRAIKTTMGMDILRCQTPAMVRKETWVFLLAYNLIRKAMLEAACEASVSPRELSFATAMQTIGASWMNLACANQTLLSTLIVAQLASLAAQRVGDRPNRVEPRAVKRWWKPMALLRQVPFVSRA